MLSYKEFLRIKVFLSKKSKVPRYYRYNYKKGSIIGIHLIGKKIKIYNGTKWSRIKVNRFFVGRRLGEFVVTRKFSLKKPKKKKKK